MTEDEDPVAVGIRLVNLIETGSRESTYKLAVLLALCHHSVEHREDESGLGLEVPLDALSERVIELYWPQLEPFGDQSSSPLMQVVRGQSAILGEIQGPRAWLFDSSVPRGAVAGHQAPRISTGETKRRYRPCALSVGAPPADQ